MPGFLRGVAGFSACALLSIASLAGSAAAITPSRMMPPHQEPVAPAAFVTRVSDYAALHREIARTLPALQPTANMDALYGTMRTLRNRLQTARRGAHQGDIITPDVAAWFRAQIATCPTCAQWQTLVAGCDDDDEDMPAPPAPLRINKELPSVACHFVPPQLLVVLPPLPPELQYRIVGRALVLWDYDANLVVDVLTEPLSSEGSVEPPSHR